MEALSLNHWTAREVPPLFSSKGCIVLGFMLKSLVHFELVLVDGIRSCMWVSSFPSTVCGKDCLSLLSGLGTLVEKTCEHMGSLLNWSVSLS